MALPGLLVGGLAEGAILFHHHEGTGDDHGLHAHEIDPAHGHHHRSDVHSGHEPIDSESGLPAAEPEASGLALVFKNPGPGRPVSGADDTVRILGPSLTPKPATAPSLTFGAIRRDATRHACGPSPPTRNATETLLLTNHALLI